ncbi:MAG: hypothetical protein P1U86_12285 [Verrucomicrobiales bacterium]|nr:hypothetical protein [Verrucomicrobiales bacterium]
MKELHPASPISLPHWQEHCYLSAHMTIFTKLLAIALVSAAVALTSCASYQEVGCGGDAYYEGCSQ